MTGMTMRRTPKKSTGATSNWSSGGDIIPDDILECLNELEIPVHRIINEEAWAICPGHEARLGRPNRHPDKWSINLDTGKHSCFSCGFKGSFVYLVQEVKDYERREAERWVRRRGGIWRLDGGVADSQGRSDLLQGQPRVRPWNEARLALFSSPPHAELGRRGLSAGSVEHYGVLWNDTLECWILPIRDPHTGELWGYQEKGNGWVKNKPARVIKGETLFGLDCFEGRTAVLFESPLDCLRFATAGLVGAVSSFGVQVSDTQLDLLFDRAEVVVFALDNDAAGIKKSLELRQRYLRSGRRIKFLNYSQIPDKKDIGTEGVTDSQIQWAFHNAQSILEYVA